MEGGSKEAKNGRGGGKCSEGHPDQGGEGRSEGHLGQEGGECGERRHVAVADCT